MFDCNSLTCLATLSPLPWTEQPYPRTLEWTTHRKGCAGGNDHHNPGQQSGDSQDQENWATSEEWEEDSLFQSILGHVADGFFREAAQLDLETQATDQQPG